MAKTYKLKTKKRPLIVRRHVERLGGEWHYKQWCKNHGFAESMDKTPRQVLDEEAAFSDIQQKVEVGARLHRNPRKLLEDICLGALHSSQIERPQWRAVALEIEAGKLNRKEAKSLLDFCLYILRVGDFLMDDGHLSGIIKLHARKRHWLRPLEDWQPKSHNSRKQFRSLTRHLLVRYEIPNFFDHVWFMSGEKSEQHRDWYVHVGAGGSIRHARTPVLLTKAMAHHMMMAPDDSSMEGAIRWGQIHALGGDPRLVDAVLGTRLATSFSDDEFWLSVFRFFIDNPLLDRQHVGPIVDFLHYQKFEDRQILEADNRVVTLPPAQPNLTMRGRTVEALLSQMELWHRALNKEARVTGEIFKPSGIDGFCMEAGDEELWMISELRSSMQLREEGRTMRHCVLSYARSCMSGDNSIWTMESKSADCTEKRQTIQVTRTGQIVQCRGKLNRLPTMREFSILQRWAKHAGLVIASHVRPSS